MRGIVSNRDPERKNIGGIYLVSSGMHPIGIDGIHN
jgi:hypothetical protein